MESRKMKWKSKSPGIIAIVIIIFGFIATVYFLLSKPFNDWYRNRDPELFAQFGDFIGGFIGTIISFAGFIFLYKTLRAQQDALNQQDSLSRQDRFESTFFNLLKTQNDLSNDLKAYFFSLDGIANEITYTVVGREFFWYSKIELVLIWKSLVSNNYIGYYDVLSARKCENEMEQSNDRGNYFDHNDFSNELKRINEEYRIKKVNKFYGITEELWRSTQDFEIHKKMKLMYSLFFYKYRYAVGHYFRHLYHILDFAEKTKQKKIIYLNSEEEINEVNNDFNKYISFIQAQMSSFELMLMFYNAMVFPKSLDLVVKYNFLENLAIEDLVDVSHNCINGIKLKKEFGIS